MLIVDHKEPLYPFPSGDPDEKALRSPIRPVPPQQAVPRVSVDETTQIAGGPPADPNHALNDLRQKMETIAAEFADGKINRAQFNAMYSRYSEQRVIIQRLIERNPESKAWKQVVNNAGHTTFLRQRFEAQPLYYVVFRHDSLVALNTGGKAQPSMEILTPVLKGLWAMPNRPSAGLARKLIKDHDQWLVLAVGKYTVTVVIFLLEPSSAQATLVRDLHQDFERANQAALARQTARLERMVFPQRALVEGNY